MAINNIGFNTQSFGTLRPATAATTPATSEATAPPSDGFQASGLKSPEATKAPITLQIPPSQLASVAFQQTLATLSASGIPVQVVLTAEQNLAPQADLSALKQNDARQDQQLDKIQSEVGYLSDRVDNFSKPKPPAYSPPTYTPPHRAPSYGSD